MGREHKYRVWDKELQVMYQFEDFRMKSTGGHWAFIRPNKQPVKAKHIVLLEFTGLQDKNGVDIYESDVVYLAGYGDYEVEFPFIELYEASWHDDIGEIKGSVFKSPDLLEDK